jgi:hypothetical protein
MAEQCRQAVQSTPLQEPNVVDENEITGKAVFAHFEEHTTDKPCTDKHKVNIGHCHKAKGGKSILYMHG